MFTTLFFDYKTQICNSMFLCNNKGREISVEFKGLSKGYVVTKTQTVVNVFAA